MKNYEALRSPKETMEFFIEDVFEVGYKQGYEDGKADTPFTDTEEAEEKAYSRGLNDAWEAAKKIHDGQISYEVFGLDRTGNGFSYASPLNWGETITAQEAITKIKAYEDKQKQDAEIKVGDEIVYGDGIKGVVVGISNTVGKISVLNNKYDVPQLLVKNRAKKTGRTFPQIAEVLAELRGTENDE